MYIRAVCCSQTRKNLYIFDNKVYGDFKEATQGKSSKFWRVVDIPYLLIPMQGVLCLNNNNNKMSFVFRILLSDNKTRNILRLQTHGKKMKMKKKKKKKKKKKNALSIITFLLWGSKYNCKRIWSNQNKLILRN